MREIKEHVSTGCIVPHEKKKFREKFLSHCEKKNLEVPVASRSTEHASLLLLCATSYEAHVSRAVSHRLPSLTGGRWKNLVVVDSSSSFSFKSNSNRLIFSFFSI